MFNSEEDPWYPESSHHLTLLIWQGTQIILFWKIFSIYSQLNSLLTFARLPGLPPLALAGRPQPQTLELLEARHQPGLLRYGGGPPPLGVPRPDDEDYKFIKTLKTLFITCPATCPPGGSKWRRGDRKSPWWSTETSFEIRGVITWRRGLKLAQTQNGANLLRC